MLTSERDCASGPIASPIGRVDEAHLVISVKHFPRRVVIEGSIKSRRGEGGLRGAYPVVRTKNSGLKEGIPKSDSVHYLGSKGAKSIVSYRL